MWKKRTCEKEENGREAKRIKKIQSFKRPPLGMGLLILFALCLLAGIRYGDRVIRRLRLDPPIRPLPVLMYHNIVSDGKETNEMTVTVSKLREDFAYLRDRSYTPILPRELLSGEPLPDKPILITFDDGYVSNYILLFPLLKEYGFKAVISPIVSLADWWDDGFCEWPMYREMAASGLVEIGSHTYNLHNPDHGGNYAPGEANGVQRRSGESGADFQSRVLQDIRKSYERITEELGTPPLCFAYPFGATDPDADRLIDELFPLSLATLSGSADLYYGTARLPRWTVTMNDPLENVLKEW